MIKDFAISQQTETPDRIKRMHLADVIRNFLKDPVLQACAERAAWLGNDEAHYERKWNHLDIRDLKTLLRVTHNFIENKLLAEKYLSMMQNGAARSNVSQRAA